MKPWPIFTVPAEHGMLDALARLLDQGIALVLITGQSVDNVEQRVVMGLPARLRRQIAVGGCSGAELWGYRSDGARKAAPYYTVENTSEPSAEERLAACMQAIDRRIPPCPLPAAAA